MLLELLEQKSNFTSSEIQIADYILKNPYDISDLTVQMLADVTFTSKSSIYRLHKKLGVDSFEKFKRRISQELIEKSRLTDLLKDEPFSKNSSISDVINILPSFYDSAVNNTRISLDKALLLRLVRKLKEAEKIDIYGSGITYSCALGAMFRFQAIGLNCTAQSAMNEHYIVYNKKKNIVAILLSFTGGNPAVMRIASFLKKQGIYIIGIGGAIGDLKSLCNAYIEIYQKELIMNMEIITPYVSMTYIFDVLFAALMVSDFEKNLKVSLDVLHIADYPARYKKFNKE